MLYGFMDESGSPGLAKTNNDFFVISLVLFKKESANIASQEINNLRKKLVLPDYYEFHRKKNAKANREAFESLISRLDYEYVTIAIRKNQLRKINVYEIAAKVLVSKISNLPDPPRIKMDINPLLHQQITLELKRRHLKGFKIKEIKSHQENLLQLADYIVNISYGISKKTLKFNQNYREILRKCTSFEVDKFGDLR